jgi:hypothetical protein
MFLRSYDISISCGHSHYKCTCMYVYVCVYGGGRGEADTGIYWFRNLQFVCKYSAFIYIYIHTH